MEVHTSLSSTMTQIGCFRRVARRDVSTNPVHPPYLPPVILISWPLDPGLRFVIFEEDKTKIVYEEKNKTKNYFKSRTCGLPRPSRLETAIILVHDVDLSTRCGQEYHRNKSVARFCSSS